MSKNINPETGYPFGSDNDHAVRDGVLEPNFADMNVPKLVVHLPWRFSIDKGRIIIPLDDPNGVKFPVPRMCFDGCATLTDAQKERIGDAAFEAAAAQYLAASMMIQLRQ